MNRERVHKNLTSKEEETLRKLSNTVFDTLNYALEMCEERIDEITREIVSAARRFLEEGR